MLLWGITIFLAMLISWVCVLTAISSITWLLWQFIYTGEPFNEGILTQLDLNAVYFTLATTIATITLLTVIVLMFSTLKMKMKWVFGKEFIQLEKEHSLCVEATNIAAQFKLKAPLVFLYRTRVATTFSIASMIKSALAFDEEILKPRQPEEYTWLINRATYINTTMYSWGLGLLTSVMWPYYFGRWLIRVSRGLFTNMQHQNHYLILAVLFLPFMFLGALLKIIGKLTFLLQHPVQLSLMKKIAAKANTVATQKTGINPRQILDTHINDINFYPGKY